MDRQPYSAEKGLLQSSGVFTPGWEMLLLGQSQRASVLPQSGPGWVEGSPGGKQAPGTVLRPDRLGTRRGPLGTPPKHPGRPELGTGKHFQSLHSHKGHQDVRPATGEEDPRACSLCSRAHS